MLDELVKMTELDLDTILDLSTQIVVLADQTIIASDSPEKVLSVRHPFIEDFFLGPRGRKVLAGMPQLNVGKVLRGYDGK